jgi:hypothetical protein
MRDRITSAIKRVQRYQFENGMYELIAGIIFVWMGILIKPLPVPNIPLWLSIIGISLTVILMGLLLEGYVYPRCIYPRSGYVNGIPATIRERLSRYLLIFPIMIPLALLIISPLFFVDSGINGDGGFSWVPFAFGLVMGLIFAFLGISLRLPRLIVDAVISIGLAIFFSPIVLSNQTYYFSNPQFPYWVIYASNIFFTAYCSLMGFALTLMGGLAFLNYLHTHPVLLETANGQ